MTIVSDEQKNIEEFLKEIEVFLKDFANRYYTLKKRRSKLKQKEVENDKL